METLRESFQGRVDALITGYRLEPARKLILSNLKPSIRISSAAVDDYSCVGNSRFGGNPDLPQGFQWPMHRSYQGDMKYSNFVAQVNLAELSEQPELDTGGLLPRQGLFSLFVSYMESAAEPAGVDGFLFTGDPKQLMLRASPPNKRLLDEYLIDLKPNRVQFHPGIDSPSHGRELLQSIDEACSGEPKQSESPKERYRSLCFELPSSGDIGQLLGCAHSHDKSDDLRRQMVLSQMGGRRYQYNDYWESIEEYEAYMKRHEGTDRWEGYQAMRPGVEWLTNNHQEIEAQVAQWTQLIRISSNRAMDIWINDADPMYVFAKKLDLSRGDLAHLTCEVTQG